MSAKDVKTLMNLVIYALQLTRIKIINYKNEGEDFKNCDAIFVSIIAKLNSSHSLPILDPVKWLFSITNNNIRSAKHQSQNHSQLLFDFLRDLRSECNRLLKINYSNESKLNWDQLFSDFCLEAHSKAPISIFTSHPGTNIERKAQNILWYLEIFGNTFVHVFSSRLAQTLPPSFEVVRTLQNIMPLAVTLQPTNSNQNNVLNIFLKLGISKYNDYIKSLTEHMSADLFNDIEQKQKQLNLLDDTFEKTENLLKRKAVNEIILALGVLNELPEIDKLINKLNVELSNFCALQCKKKITGILRSIQTFFRNNSAGIYGAFIAGVIINFLFVGPGTALLRQLQSKAPEMFTSLISMRDIFSQLASQNSTVAQNLTQLYEVPLFNTSSNMTCANSIYHNYVNSNNTTILNLLKQAEESSLSFLSSLFYSDKLGCPVGGKDSFPPQSFINYPNLAISAVSIGSGFLACLYGWAEDLKHDVNDAIEYESIPNVFQDFSTTVTENQLKILTQHLPQKEKKNK